MGVGYSECCTATTNRASNAQMEGSIFSIPSQLAGTSKRRLSYKAYFGHGELSPESAVNITLQAEDKRNSAGRTAVPGIQLITPGGTVSQPAVCSNKASLSLGSNKHVDQNGNVNKELPPEPPEVQNPKKEKGHRTPVGVLPVTIHALGRTSKTSRVPQTATANNNCGSGNAGNAGMLASPERHYSKAVAKDDSSSPEDGNSSKILTEALLDWSRDKGCPLPCLVAERSHGSLTEYVSNIYDTHLQCDVMDVEKGAAETPQQALSVQGLLAESTARFPKQTALVDGVSGGSWCSYTQLGMHVRRVASGLQKAGLCRGKRLVLVCPPCPEAIVAMLATLALGATFVPLSPDFSPAILLKHLQVLKPAVVMMSAAKWCVDNTLWAAGSCASVKCVYVLGEADHPSHSFRALLEDDGAACPDHVANTPGDIAIIVHTTDVHDCSRFFKFTYATFVESILLVLNSPQLGLGGQREVVLVGLPLNDPFVIVSLICVGLTRGFTLITLSQPSRALKACHKHRVTILPLTTHWISRLSKIQKGSMRRPVLPPTVLVSGGATPCTAHQLDVLYRRGAHKVVFVYCVTELMGPVAACTLPKEYQQYPNLQLLRGVSFKVIDLATNKTLEDHERGTVLVSCPPLTYRPSRCDVTEQDQERWINTGCIGHMDQAGTPCISGYKSDLVVHAGDEMWMTDLDELLVKHVAVLDAAVVELKPAGDTDVTSLRAAIVLREGYGGVTGEDISDFVHAQPDCPAFLEAVAVVPSIPRAGTGRVLRHTLSKQLAAVLACTVPWTSV